MAGPQDLPSDVRDATDRHLAVLDAVAPGLVGGLYLTGSATLSDYQPGRSDIDFMAFTTHPAGGRSGRGRAARPGAREPGPLDRLRRQLRDHGRAAGRARRRATG
jgi:hypothetical protein